MNVIRSLATTIGWHEEMPADEFAELLREARIEAARHQRRWTELDPVDLVPRDGGRILVSAASDAMYRAHRGVVFATSSVEVIADMAPLAFYVDEDGGLVFLERMPGTWSDVVARRARRG